MLVAVLLFTFTSLIAKQLGGPASNNPLHPLQISGCRFIFGFLTVSLLVFRWNLREGNSPWVAHIARAFFGWLGISALFAASMQIPLADANAVGFLSVFVAMLISGVFLKERIGRSRWIAALIALCGGLLIVKPGTGVFDPATLIAVLAALFIGVEIVLIKLLSNNDHPFRILFFNNLIGAGISLAIIPAIWVVPTIEQWLGLIAIGAIMVLAQFFNILAMQRADASFVAPYWLAVPLFAAILDYLYFSRVLSGWSTIGIVLIVFGGLAVYRTRSR